MKSIHVSLLLVYMNINGFKTVSACPLEMNYRCCHPRHSLLALNADIHVHAVYMTSSTSHTKVTPAISHFS